MRLLSISMKNAGPGAPAKELVAKRKAVEAAAKYYAFPVERLKMEWNSDGLFQLVDGLQVDGRIVPPAEAHVHAAQRVHATGACERYGRWGRRGRSGSRGISTPQGDDENDDANQPDDADKEVERGEFDARHAAGTGAKR